MKAIKICGMREAIFTGTLIELNVHVKIGKKFISMASMFNFRIYFRKKRKLNQNNSNYQSRNR